MLENCDEKPKCCLFFHCTRNREFAEAIVNEGCRSVYNSRSPKYGPPDSNKRLGLAGTNVCLYTDSVAPERNVPLTYGARGDPTTTENYYVVFGVVAVSADEPAGRNRVAKHGVLVTPPKGGEARCATVQDDNRILPLGFLEICSLSPAAKTYAAQIPSAVETAVVAATATVFAELMRETDLVGPSAAPLTFGLYTHHCVFLLKKYVREQVDDHTAKSGACPEIMHQLAPYLEDLAKTFAQLFGTLEGRYHLRHGLHDTVIGLVGLHLQNVSKKIVGPIMGCGEDQSADIFLRQCAYDLAQVLGFTGRHLHPWIYDRTKGAMQPESWEGLVKAVRRHHRSESRAAILGTI